MKFEIMVYFNLKDKVKIKNIGDQDYLNPKLPILAGEEKEVSTGIAKQYFGDWEDESYGEKKRQIKLNIHLIQVKIRTELAQISRSDQQVDLSPIQEKIEPEFEHLKLLNPEPIEKIQCKGRTKSGKQCKREALPGEEFCAGHKE